MFLCEKMINSSKVNHVPASININMDTVLKKVGEISIWSHIQPQWTVSTIFYYLHKKQYKLFDFYLRRPSSFSTHLLKGGFLARTPFKQGKPGWSSFCSSLERSEWLDGRSHSSI